MNTLIDTHIHLTEPPFANNIPAVIHQYKTAGVDTVLVPGFSFQSNENIKKIKEEYPEIAVAFGVHPLFDTSRTDTRQFLVSLLQSVQCSAIGEMGLDYRKNAPSKLFQINRFNEQLEIAAEKKLPVIIHCVNAHLDCLDCLKKYHHHTKTHNLLLTGILHRASCSIDQARNYLNFGLCFSFGPDIFDSQRRHLRNLAAWIPENRILVETDAPYTRNKTGNMAGPWDLPDILIELALLRKTSVETLSSAIRINTRDLLGV
ncbi:TatD family hydrolase [bacterium]|nr:TatD family hydrolase [bacterium]